jgi:hypothetical protein
MYQNNSNIKANGGRTMTKKEPIVIHGLTVDEREVIDRAAKDLGYKDLTDMVAFNGCSSIEEFLRDFNFTSVRDFFFGHGWFERLEPFRRNGKRSTSSTKKAVASRHGKHTSRLTNLSTVRG